MGNEVLGFKPKSGKDTKLSPNFRRMLDADSQGQEFVPKVMTYLHSPQFEGYALEVPGFDVRREPDGWFHPSSHPLWTEWQLYTYLTAPDRLRADPFEYDGAIAVTAGSFFHDFLQRAGVDCGAVVEQPPECGCGAICGQDPEHPNRAEVYAEDGEAGVRGHADGQMVESGRGLEIKTMHPMKQAKVSEIGLDYLKDKNPDYYLQAQEYMRMRGWEAMVVVTVSMSYPFKLDELVIPYDRVAAMRTREKYLRVRSYAADGREPPRGECCMKPKDCPAKLVCPGGLG